MAERDARRSNKILQVWVKRFGDCDLEDDYVTIDKFDPTGKMQYFIDFNNMYWNKVYNNLTWAEKYLTKLGYERVE